MTTNFVKIKDKKGYIFHKDGEVESRLEKLTPGLYEIYDGGGLFQTLYIYEPYTVKENLIQFKTGVAKDILERTSRLFSEETTNIYKEMGMLQKAGLIMFGPPGTGKTCLAQLIMMELVEKYGAICMDATDKKPGFITSAVHKVRQIQDNPVVIFIDEIETTLSAYESDWLTILDGNDSLEKCLIMGCTNFLKKVPKRIRDRKSRIKDVIEIKSLPHDVYKEFITAKSPTMKSHHVEKFAYLSVENGLTIDELKHALISHRVDRYSIEDAIREVKDYKEQEDWDND